MQTLSTTEVARSIGAVVLDVQHKPIQISRRDKPVAVLVSMARWVEVLKALQWTGGSVDFGHGGQARKGWLKIVAPLLVEADEGLWAIHVVGPDDIIAVPDRDVGESICHMLGHLSEADPPVELAVVPWPHDPDSHALELTKGAWQELVGRDWRSQ